MGIFRLRIDLKRIMTSKKNIINAFSILAIIFCAAGLAGSLIEQIDGTPKETEPSSSVLALSTQRKRRQSDSTSNSTSELSDITTVAPIEDTPDVEIVRFTISSFNSLKICELAALAVGMLFGIFALFSVVIERKSIYVICVILSIADALLSGGVLGIILFTFTNSGILGEEESFDVASRWSLWLPLGAMCFNIPFKLT